MRLSTNEKELLLDATSEKEMIVEELIHVKRLFSRCHLHKAKHQRLGVIVGIYHSHTFDRTIFAEEIEELLLLTEVRQVSYKQLSADVWSTRIDDTHLPKNSHGVHRVESEARRVSYTNTQIDDME